MIATELSKQLFKLTEKKDFESGLKVILPEYLKLRIYFLKQQIAQFEMKWNLTYEEFEKKSVEMPEGFAFETEQEYYEWGEKVALVQHYQNLLKEWI